MPLPHKFICCYATLYRSATAFQQQHNERMLLHMVQKTEQINSKSIDAQTQYNTQKARKHLTQYTDYN